MVRARLLAAERHFGLENGPMKNAEAARKSVWRRGLRKKPFLRALLAIAQAWSMPALASSEDGGVSAQRDPVQLEIADYRPLSQRAPTQDEIRAALVQILKERRIPVTSNATMRLRLELLEAEKRDEEGVKACARVRSRIVETSKEYLPKGEVLTERCVLTSQPRVPAAGSINWIGVADAISRMSHKKDSLTDAYAEALSEVIATLERRLAR